MATADGMAAPEAALPPCPVPGRSAWPDRRRRQQAAKESLRGRLDSALGRVVELEREVAGLRGALAAAEVPREAAGNEVEVVVASPSVSGAPVAPADIEACADLPTPTATRAEELVERLALAAPSIEAGIDAAATALSPTACAVPRELGEWRVPHEVRLRRDAALHSFHVPAARIRQMGRRSLNALRRKPRVDGGQRHRRIPALRTPAEQVGLNWAMARRPHGRAESLPAMRWAIGGARLASPAISGPKFRFEELVDTAVADSLVQPALAAEAPCQHDPGITAASGVIGLDCGTDYSLEEVSGVQLEAQLRDVADGVLDVGAGGGPDLVDVHRECHRDGANCTDGEAHERDVEVPVAPDPWDAVVGTGRGGNRSAARVDVQSLLFVVDVLDKRSVPLTYSYRLRRAAERIRALTAHAVPVACASAFAPLGAKPSPNEIVLHKRLSDLYKRHGVDAYCPCGHQLAVQSAARPFRCANCRGRVVGPYVTCGTGHFKACPACAQAVVDS